MNGRTVPKAGASEAAAPGAGDRGPEAVVVVSIHVKPGYEEEFLRLVTPVPDAMRHEATFVNAVLHRDPEDSTRFMLYETWADRDDLLRVQVHREYRKAYWARLPEILREPRQIQVWQPVRGDFAFFSAAHRSHPIALAGARPERIGHRAIRTG
ncbi:MAG TPA: putative quinol monooxygenase [Thermodesulfobacteriota bacterium]